MNRDRVIVVAAILCAGGWARGQCQYGVGGINIPIPDLGSASYALQGYGPGSVVNSVRVCFSAAHGRQGDLIVRLEHAGITATLLNRPGTEDGLSTVGYTAANIGAGSSFTLVDDAAAPYAVPPVGLTPRPGIAGVSGMYKPTVDPLSMFVGTPVAGPWTLTILDAAPGFSGTWYSMSMAINEVVVGECWANCDGSIFQPALTGSDFMCFMDSFAGGGSYANCDQSTGTPLLTPNDFQCFLNAYAAGCS